MGIRIFVGHEAGTDIEDAILVDSVTGTPFGSLISPPRDSGVDAEDYADAFLAFARTLEPSDLRSVTDLRFSELLAAFHAHASPRLVMWRGQDAVRHTKDDDCLPDERGVCIVCGVRHQAYPCECGGYSFHKRNLGECESGEPI